MQMQGLKWSAVANQLDKGFKVNLVIEFFQASSGSLNILRSAIIAVTVHICAVCIYSVCMYLQIWTGSVHELKWACAACTQSAERAGELNMTAISVEWV
jgi:hypothetical protein